MSLIGIYVLRANGELVFFPLDQDSLKPIWIKAWEVRGDDRFDFWRIVVEAQALGAKPERIQELTEKWGLTDEDGIEFAKRLGVEVYKQRGLWCASVWSNFKVGAKTGFGMTVRDALAELYRKLNEGARRK